MAPASVALPGFFIELNVPGRPMPRLLILLTLPPNVTDQYRQRFQRAFPELEIDVAATPGEAATALARADCLLTFGQMMKNLKLSLGDAHKLKWVQALGTGLDGIADQPALKPGVTVTNLHGVHGPPVSEAALASMLALSRDLPGFVRAQDERQWKRWPAKLLHEKTVGILGIGIIAEALGPKCKAMGMTVAGVTSAPRKVAGFDRVHPVSDLLKVLPEFDYFVLLTPYSAATHQMINAKVFEAMKPTAYLVNVARGGVVDEDALVEALRAKKFAGAALDVFSQEPLPSDHPLWGFKNVIITTHQGGFCDTYVDLAMPILEHNMRCYLKGDLKGMMNVARPAA
jgi:phosphoglycerate dehydrogenase-like enzyme